ncbi:MAG: hypothetical protein GY861_04805 [bacterium]|nr:hypothetical protein [bacterium]
MKTFISYLISGGALTTAVVSVFGGVWNISPDVTTLAGNVALAYGVLYILCGTLLSTILGFLLFVWKDEALSVKLKDNPKALKPFYDIQGKHTFIKYTRMTVLWGVVCSHFIYQGWIVTGVLHFITGLLFLNIYRKIVKLELPETETVVKG